MTPNAVKKPAPGELEKALWRNDIKAVEELLKQGADVHEENSHGRSMLNLAAGNGYVEIARLLIAYGADVNKKNAAGNTPLILAAAWGHAEMVHLLVDSGADVNACNNSGYTAASEVHDNDELARFLEEAGKRQQQRAEVEARTKAKIEEARAAAAQKQQRLNAVRESLIIRRLQP